MIVITYKRSKRYFRWIPLGLILLLFSTPAYGDIILSTDSNAMSGWHGTTPFHAAGTKIIDGHIDYAVYLPNQFDLSFPGLTDPSAASNYVYAYQIFSSSVSTDAITGFSVGLDGDESPVFNGILGSGVLSSTHYFSGSPATSSVWFFQMPNRITTGTNSSILYFTSPNGPETDLASVKAAAGPYTWTGTLPSPVPEPSTLLGLAVFAGLFPVARFVRRKSPA
jgi:hypothetical protein